MERCADHNDPETWQTARGSQLIQTDQTTPNNEQNLGKATLRRLCPILGGNRILLDHNFGFRQEHSTIEQVHRITEIRKNCAALRRS
jgi:hypothetical protein